ncbi:MAG: AI-2E family transporter [Clostridiales bacterium]|nr:AI-2E family transporter [Clostridiales bacterium]
MRWKDKMNRKYLQISLYVIITVVIIYFLKLLMDNGPVILIYLMNKLGWLIRVSRPVIIGFVFAYIIQPVVDFFEGKYEKLKRIKYLNRIVHPRTWAAITSVVLLFIVLAGLITLLVFIVTKQLKLANLDDLTMIVRSYINSFEKFINSITIRLDQLDIKSEEIEKYVENASGFVLNVMKDFTDALVNAVTNISGYLTTIIFSFIIGFYFLIDGKMFISYIRKMSMALFSDNINKKLRNIVSDLDMVFSGYIRGQLTDALVMMILISVTLSIIKVKFAIIIGVFAGVGNLIPYVGPIVAYISTSVVCLLNGDTKTWVVAMIALLLIQTIDGNVINPKLLSHSIKIHPLIVIVSIIFGSALGGFLGMLLAVPLGAYVKLIIVRFIDRRLEAKESSKKQ